MIDFQRKILGDTVRNRALYEALKKVIVPGKTTVSDIGAGTGFLSFLALKAGAKECFLYDHADILGLARKIAKENGFEKKCHFIPFHSSDVQSPVKTDLVISETLGNFATEEHIIENMEDAKRFLKPGGMMIPQTLTQYIVPVIAPRILREIDVWDRVGFPLDLQEARTVALNNLYVQKVRKGDLLPGKDAPKIWDTVDFWKKNRSIRKGEVSWKIFRNLRIYGFACFWDCELVPGIHLSTSPFAKPTHWEQIFLPLLKKVDCKRGETLTLRITSDTRHDTGLRVQWQTKHVSMDTKKGG